MLFTLRGEYWNVEKILKMPEINKNFEDENNGKSAFSIAKEIQLEAINDNHYHLKENMDKIIDLLNIE